MDLNEGKSLRLGYVLWRFPALSETFILRRIVLLNKLLPAMNFELFSIKKPLDNRVHELAEPFVNSRIYVPKITSPKLLFTVLINLVKSPIEILSTCFMLLKEIPFKISLRLSWYYFMQATYSMIIGVYLAYKLKRAKVNHVHTHYAQTAALITRIASRVAGIPYSLTTHAHDIFQNENKVLITNLIKNAEFCITISQYNKNYLTSLDVSLENKIYVIHSAIDLKKFRPKAEVKNDKFKILTVARLVETKGILETIAACASLPDNIDYRYDVVGEGPLRAEIELAIKKNHLEDRVHLHGEKTEQEVFNFMEQADLSVLFCTISEDGNMDGIPNVLMESLAMKIPVITTSISGIPELVRDGVGILLDEKEPERIADKIVEIYHMSPGLKQNKAERGRKIVEEEFNVEIEAGKIARLFLDAVEKNRFAGDVN